MALGPGKYDSVCTLVREMTKAEGVVLMVFNGVHGNGFSAQASAPIHLAMADALESVAEQLREAGPLTP